jgi:hypothetical protein
MIRVILPSPLRVHANIEGEVRLEVAPPVTQRRILDELEKLHPVLVGTLRDHVTQQRRPLVRFFACGEDVSFESPDTPLPQAIADGTEALYIIGAIAGGGESHV